MVPIRWLRVYWTFFMGSLEDYSWFLGVVKICQIIKGCSCVKHGFCMRYLSVHWIIKGSLWVLLRLHQIDKRLNLFNFYAVVISLKPGVKQTKEKCV